MSFVQLTMKQWIGLSWVELTDVQQLSWALMIRWEQEAEENTTSIWNCWVLGKRDRIWPEPPEYRDHHGDGIQRDPELGDGFNTSFDTRGSLNTEHHYAHCFQRETALSMITSCLQLLALAVWVVCNSSSERAKLIPSCEHTEKAFVAGDDAGIVVLTKSAEKQHLAAGRGKNHFFQEHTGSCFDVAFKLKQGHVLNSQ